MRNRLLRQAALGTAAALLAAGAVVGASGTASAAPAHATATSAVTTAHWDEDRDDDCHGREFFGRDSYGDYYGGGLLSLLL